MQDSFENDLLEGLRHWGGESIDISCQVYDMLSRQPDKGKALQFFLENVDNIVSSEDRKVEVQFSKEDLQRLRKQYYRFAKQMLQLLFSQELSLEQFYEQLWLVIGENVLLPTDREKIYVLDVVRSDIRIPYFKLEKGLIMEGEEFSEITSRKRREIKRALVIVSADYEQRTERSSLLMKILEGCNEREKVVILAHILSGVEQKVLSRIRKVMQEATDRTEKE